MVPDRDRSLNNDYPVKIRQAQREDIPDLVRLFGNVFGKETSSDHWEWKYYHPDCPAFSVVAEMDGEILGHFGGQIFPGTHRGIPIKISAVTDIMTDKRIRHFIRDDSPLKRMSSLYFDVMEREGISFLTGFPGTSSRRFGEKFLNYRQVSTVKRIECAVTGKGSVALSPDIPDQLPSSLPRGYSCGILRSREYLRWRYIDRPGHEYLFAERDGNVAVVKMTREGIILMDLMVARCSRLEDLIGNLDWGDIYEAATIKAWLPNRLIKYLRKLKPSIIPSDDYVLEYRPVCIDPGCQYLAKKLFFMLGDYDVE